MCASFIPLRKYCVKTAYSHESITGLSPPGEGLLATRILLYPDSYKIGQIEPVLAATAAASNYAMKTVWDLGQCHTTLWRLENY